MKTHLRKMANMIAQLNDVVHKLNEQQKDQAIICSLPNSWEHIKLNLTHARDIKTFNDVVHHLEFEEDTWLP